MPSIIVAITFVGVVAGAVVGPVVGPLTETKDFNLNDISRVEVKNSSGDVKVTAAAKGKATVTAEKKRFGDSCKMTIEKRGKTLFVEVEKQGGFFAGECEVNFAITAPKNTALDLDSGSGRVNVNGTSGDLAFNLGSGSIDVNAEVKALDGKIGSGDIEISGLTSGGSIRAGSGDIDLVYKVAPTQGDLDIKTGSGDAEITFPKKSKIRTDFSAGSGSLTNELGDTMDSKFKVSMKAGSGSLHIKK